MSETWMVKLSILCILIFISYSMVCCKGGEIHPDVDLTLEQVVRKHGYPIEAYQVMTDDDYIISAYNIPHGLKKDENKNKSAVLLIHGMAGSPHNFVAIGKEIAPAYYLADKGMDVWLLSARGLDGSFKQKHKTLDWDKDPKYWLHSFHEIGKYDLAATIDLILNYTGQKKITLIGHSAGGHEFFCLFSEKPEYNAKVKLAINWGSSLIITLIDFPLERLFCSFVDVFKGIIKYTGMAEFLPFFQSLKPTLKLMCADPEWQKFCILATWIVGSHKSYLQRPNDAQLIISSTPRIASREVLHFMDNVNNGSFRQYDHGTKGNMRHYGQRYPPHYNLSATAVPVAFFIGPNDADIIKEDVYQSMEHIPNTVMVYEVPFSKFTHLDFIFGINSTILVYEPTYRLINDIDNGIVPPKVTVPPNYA